MLDESVAETWKTVAYFLIFILFIFVTMFAFLNITGSASETAALKDASNYLEYVLAKWESSPGVLNLSKVSQDDLPENSEVKIYFINGTLARTVSKGALEGDAIEVRIPVMVDGNEGLMVFRKGR